MCTNIAHIVGPRCALSHPRLEVAHSECLSHTTLTGPGLRAQKAWFVVLMFVALLGVRAILFDFGLSDQAEQRVTGALTILGALTIGYGLCLTWVVINL